MIDAAERPSWINESNRFWYRKSVEGGNSFMLVDAATQAKGPAFDHERLAAALSALATIKCGVDYSRRGVRRLMFGRRSLNGYSSNDYLT